jgi:hypothetical protein
MFEHCDTTMECRGVYEKRLDPALPNWLVPIRETLLSRIMQRIFVSIRPNSLGVCYRTIVDEVL